MYLATFDEVVGIFSEIRSKVGYLVQPDGFVVENDQSWGDIAGFCCEEDDEILFGINGPFEDRTEMKMVIIHEASHLKQVTLGLPVCHDDFFYKTEEKFKSMVDI
jgi:hypothetical protein